MRVSRLCFSPFLALMLGILVLASSGMALADHPWPMFRHNPTHSAVSPYHDPAPNLPAWKLQVGGGLSSPVIADNGDSTYTIYIGGGSGRLCALNMDGTLKWVSYLNISRSTPAVGADGTIYVGGVALVGTSYAYALVAVSPLNGSIVWAYRVGNEITSSPAIANGVVYVGSKDGYLYAIDELSGALMWRYYTGGQIHMCSPVVGSDGTVYIGGGSGRLQAVDGTTGLRKWSFQTGSQIMSSPALSPDGSRIYAGSCDGYLYAINTADGSKVWQVPVPLIAASTSPSPAVAPDGTIYIGSNGGTGGATSGTVHAISPEGTPIWEYQTTYDVRSSPAISADGTVYIGVMDGSIYAFSSNGTVKWRYLANGGIYGSPAVAADGSIYVQTIGGVLYGNLTCTPPTTTLPSNLVVELLSENSVRLTWQDNSSDEYGFVIQRKIGANGTFADVGTRGAGATTFDNTGLGSGQTYYYRVCAYQEGGNSAPSNEAGILTPGLPSPTDLTATPVCITQIDLSWTDVSDGELGYKIERMQGPVGPFRQIARVGPNVTKFSDMSVYEATNYYYRVRAYDDTRNSSPSNEAWALTPGYDFTNILIGNTDRRQMALTYDAGTSNIQSSLLNTLRDKGVYCNFFVTGAVTQTQSALAKRIADEGHLLGNHSIDHPQFPFITDDQIARQLTTTDEIIYSKTGHRTRPWFRAPYGSYNDHVLEQLEQNGFRHVAWTVDCGDASWGSGRDEIVWRLTYGACNGAVALLHCTVGETAAATPLVIDNLRAMGYELVTVPELVAPVQISSPADALAPGWSFISLPVQPANTTPMVVFRGLNIAGRLMCWDCEAQQFRTFDAANPAAFGQIDPDQGYWLYTDAPATVKINGSVANTDRHIKLPQTLSNPNGALTAFGYTFDIPQRLKHLKIFNPNAKAPQTRTYWKAVAAGWISPALYTYDPATGSAVDLTMGKGEAWAVDLQPWHGYWIKSNVNELELIIPKPEIDD